MEPRQTLEGARAALRSRQFSDWPPWQDKLLQAAEAFARQEDTRAVREALVLWKAFSEQRGSMYWGRAEARIGLLATMDGMVPPEFRSLLENPPQKRGAFSTSQ